MANIFSGSEIAELGVQIEKNGRDFYGVLTRLSKNQSAAGIFEFLAKEEEKHIGIFKKILINSEKNEAGQVYSDEYTAYMNALARECVFTQKYKGRDIAKKITGYKEALELAIGFEKDSIIFYEGIKQFVPEYDKAVVDDLIGQERKHLRQLSDLKKEIKEN